MLELEELLLRIVEESDELLEDSEERLDIELKELKDLELKELKDLELLELLDLLELLELEELLELLEESIPYTPSPVTVSPDPC